MFGNPKIKARKITKANPCAYDLIDTEFDTYKIECDLVDSRNDNCYIPRF